MSYISPVLFDVTKFGARGDPGGDDTSAIQSAVNAAVSAGGGCVYFPKGTYKIASAITKTNPYCSLVLRGDGSKVSLIKQTTSGADGFKFDLMAPINAGSFAVGQTYRIVTVGSTNFMAIGASNNNVGTVFVATGAGSGSGTADEPYNVEFVVDVIGLGFIAAHASVACGAALTLGYGTNAGSSEQNRGPVVCDININVASGAKGWTNGLVMNTCWHADIKDVYAYGSDLTYASGSGAGSGAGITLNGGVNILVGNVQCEWWSVGVLLQKGAASLGNQGVLIESANIVECVKGIRVLGDGDYNSGSHTITGVVIDSGNVTSDGIALVLSGVREVFVSNCYFIVKGTNNPVCSMKGVTESVLSNCQFFGTTPQGVLMETDGGSVACKNNIVTNCVFRGQTYEVQIGSGSTGNIVRDNQVTPAQTRSCIDNDGGNKIGDVGGKQVSVSRGGAMAVNIDVDITEFALGKKPSSGMISKADFYEDSPIVGGYDFANGASTKTNARFRIYMASGAALPNQTRAFNIVVSP